jgi:MFS family permease
MNSLSPGLSSPATRVRYSILGLLCALAMITYMDRAVYGSARDDIMSSVGRPTEDIFYLLTAFQIAYALFEVPAGWMGDRFGPRGTLLRIVLWWSGFIALTALVPGIIISQTAQADLPIVGPIMIGFVVIVAMQFLFGMGEAGAFPNITRALYNWFPSSQRGSAQGTIWLAARLMGGLTPAVWVIFTIYLGFSWRETLWLFAGLAAVWCGVFLWWFRNKPDEHPSVNEAERTLINSGKTAYVDHSGVPWGKIFGSRTLWFMCAMYMVTNFCWYFLMYFLPGELRGRFQQMNSTPSGKLLVALLAGSPLLIGMFGCMWGGVLTDRWVRVTGDRKWGRRVYAMIGYGMAGVCYLLATLFVGDFWPFVGCVVMMGFFNDLIMGSAWATCQDVGRRYAAIVAGTMNMIGNLGAAVGNFVTGTILKSYKEAGDPDGGIRTLFIIYASVYFVGVLLWLRIDASKPIIEEH